MRFMVCVALGVMILGLTVAGPGQVLAEGPPIRIGASVSLEGSYKEPSAMIRQAFLLWQEEINQKGGLLGRTVELILHDDKSSADLAAELYRKLIEEEGVDLVFSPYGTPLTLAASAISEEHGRVMIACAASGSAVWDRGFRHVFGMYALADRYFIGLLDLMARRGMDSLALVYDASSSFNIDVAEGVKQWAQTFRIAVTSDDAYHDDAEDLPAVISRLKSGEVDRVILSAYPPDCYRFLELMQETGYRPRVLGMTIAPIHPDFADKAGAVGDRVFGPSQWEPRERIPFPGTQQFVAAFKSFTDRMPSYHAGSAYAACQLYENAIRETGSLDNDTIRDYIARLDTVTVIGRFKVDVSGRQIGHNPIIIQWQGGEKEIVWPTKMQTAPPLF